MKPRVVIPSEQIAGDWIEKNIKKMMFDIFKDARLCRPLPLSITLHGVAYNKFIEALKSQSSYFPEAVGKFSFIGVPVYENNRLPYGTFVVERVRGGSGLLVK